jgi:deoxyribonuclease-4
MFWDVGCHTGFCEHITPTILEGVEKGMETIQFFMGNPKQAWKRQTITEKDIKSTQDILTRFPMNVFSHFPYCANLAGKSEKDGIAWNGNYEVDRSLSGVIKAIEYELSILANFSDRRSGVVIHPGSYPDRELGHRTVSKTLNKISFPDKSVLLLENCAGEGNKLCRSFEEIKLVLDGIDKTIKPHVKVCVDTAHIWGVGNYDLRLVEEVDRMFEEFDKIIGIDNFYLLHLNDSMVPIGTRKDLHACLGTGKIWEDNFDSLIHLLNMCKKHNIPILLETSPVDMLTINAIQPK